MTETLTHSGLILAALMSHPFTACCLVATVAACIYAWRS